ncbi:replication endonuclease [Erwiniaceae bacterium BAC15a-03b]|uniref:Replication endonuclease n=1 Tax=Winslowiella arboricola TaxID=2978220 RepID=A0A9J6PQ54_9GAMM|nr:replication endonuclease [Winslowiella arboricola]MCU5773092.1 replication endonuclease [Winslowiella arboricola]MCU5777813.1 replication endonuclease [Winslowiella arboricola]
MKTDYAFPWNTPREAIASPYPTYDEINRRDQMIAALSHAKEILEEQPITVRLDINRRLAELEKEHGVQRANAYLTKTFVERTLPRLELVNAKYRLDFAEAPHFNIEDTPTQRGTTSDIAMVQLMRRLNRLADMPRADIDLLAGDIANFITSELIQVNEETRESSEYKALFKMYMTCARITRQLGQAAPQWERITSKFFSEDDAAPAIYKMKSERWWLNRLRRIAAEWREHIQIALANVSKKKNPYASKMTVHDWREQKRRTREFLKGMELEDEEGNRISLIEKYDGSVANPAIRRCELMTRIRGFENICNQMGYVGEFYTITSPARYHATIKTGHRNRKWNGTSPADTQRYLRGVWEKVRAKLHRQDLRIFGIRVAEPHHDGTPHWHMLLFMRTEHVEQVREIMRHYASEQDNNELTSDKARKARFHAEAIDPEKGSATGYVAKYISKNIDGYALDGETDDESGQLLKDTAPAVSAWAARWRIRQFQFVGGAPVTVYRELRRMDDSETAHGLSVEFAEAHDAADAGDWAAYVNAQGGPFVRRDDLAVRTWYQPASELNEYGEETLRLQGLYATSVGNDTPILTRLTQWKIVAKRAVELAIDLQDAPASSRSSVNNCTGRPGSEDPPTPVSSSEIDFNSVSRKERRHMLNRIRGQRIEKQHKKLLRPASVESACDRAIAEIRDLTGEVISRALAVRLIRGADTEILGRWYRGAADGAIYSAKAPRNVKADLTERCLKLAPKVPEKRTKHHPLVCKYIEKALEDFNISYERTFRTEKDKTTKNHEDKKRYKMK